MNALPHSSARNPLWLSTEVRRLIVAVNLFGTRNWNRISREVRTRSPIECRNRWCRMIHNACLLLLVHCNSGLVAPNLRPRITRITRRPRVVNPRQLNRFRNAINQNAAQNNPINPFGIPRRDIRMSLDYILN